MALRFLNIIKVSKTSGFSNFDIVPHLQFSFNQLWRWRPLGHNKYKIKKMDSNTSVQAQACKILKFALM